MAAPLAERRSGGRAGNNLFNRIGYPQGSLTVPDTHEQVGRSGGSAMSWSDRPFGPISGCGANASRLGEMIAREFPD